MPKYHVTLQSGRDFFLNLKGDFFDFPQSVEEVAWTAYDEACLMDDYLENVEPITDV